MADQVLKMKADSDLAQALMSIGLNGAFSQHFLVLKDERGESQFRAGVRGWVVANKFGEKYLEVTLESWEDYCERQAKRFGL